MKKLLTVVMMLAIVSVCAAQGKNKTEKVKVDFYGIDFTDVNVIGANETSEKFIDAFEQINGLFFSEASKYNVAEFFNLEVASTDTETATDQLDSLQNVKFKNQKHSNVDINKIVAAYPESDINGFLIIAKELNKGANTGTFIAVMFNGQTKQILSQKEFTGKAHGFGLRNFWAGSFYDGMKRMK
ncbi:MAG: hypothetical protein RSB93_00765 [Rikenellaceae bacterium]